jgi:hypothetical protein
VHTTACHLSLPWARLIHSMPFNPISLIFILISSHLCLHVAGAAFLQVSPPKDCTHLSAVTPLCRTVSHQDIA